MNNNEEKCNIHDVMDWRYVFSLYGPPNVTVRPPVFLLSMAVFPLFSIVKIDICSILHLFSYYSFLLSIFVIFISFYFNKNYKINQINIISNIFL